MNQLSFGWNVVSFFGLFSCPEGRWITKARKAQSAWRIAIKIKGSSQSAERKKLKDQVNEGMSLFQLLDPEKSHYVRTTHEMGAEGL